MSKKKVFSLIEEVKKHEFIYNNAHHDHGKRSPTLKTWSKIASAVGDTVQQCKSRWQSLRRRYETEYAKSKSVDVGYESDWMYMEAMSFLEGYVGSNQHFLQRLSKMSKRDMFCRACLCPVKFNSTEKSCKSYNIFDTENFADKLMQCTNIKSVIWDEYPHSVCEKCYEKVLEFHQFQVMCRNSLDKFLEIQQDQTGTKVEGGTEISNNTLNTLVGHTDLNSVLLQEQLFEITSTSADESEFFKEIPENHTDIICESAIKEDMCGTDPLAEPTNMDSVLEKNKEVDNSPDINDDTLETGRCNEVINKRRTRQRKTESNKKKKGRKQLDMTEDEYDLKPEAAEPEDVDSATFEDHSDDESSISDNSEESVVEEIKLSRSPLKCDICPQTFRFPHRLEAHQRKHKGLPGYCCTFENCERAYNRLDDLKNHLNDHNGIPNIYKCTIDNCNMIYKCFSGLNKHKRKFHKCGKELKTYTCETCGKVLTNPRSLTGHRFIHLDKSQWPFVCNEKDCTRRFRLMSQLIIHKKRHAGIKNYVCPHCGVRKTTCTELKIHINFHTFEQKFPCGFCSKVFKSVGMKRTHINRVHEGKKPTNGTIFACRFCDRKFGSLQSKKYHEMTHTGEKPFACEECGKTFTYPSGLKSHKNSHVKGENPYACEQCDRKFKWPSALKTHMKLHTEGAKPYACEECGKGFRWPGSYYKHKKTHTGHKEENAENDDIGEEEVDAKDGGNMEPARTEYEITYLVGNM